MTIESSRGISFRKRETPFTKRDAALRNFRNGAVRLDGDIEDAILPSRRGRLIGKDPTEKGMYLVVLDESGIDTQTGYKFEALSLPADKIHRARSKGEFSTSPSPAKGKRMIENKSPVDGTQETEVFRSEFSYATLLNSRKN